MTSCAHCFCFAGVDAVFSPVIQQYVQQRTPVLSKSKEAVITVVHSSNFEHCFILFLSLNPAFCLCGLEQRGAGETMPTSSTGVIQAQ